MSELTGKVAIVTGASKGIARNREGLGRRGRGGRGELCL